VNVRTKFIFAAICTLLSGCAATIYHEPKGPLLIRFTFGTDQFIGPIEMKSKDSTVKVGGVKTEQASTAAAAAAAAVKAAKPSLFP
jgi:hypothetical protein